MKEIPLTKGKAALVDDEDYPLISQYKWHAIYNEGSWYARGTVNGKRIVMHRVICPGIQQLDHKNRNGLDNQKCNLRPCNDHLNQGNQRLRKDKTSSRFKGVYWNYKSNGWESRIRSSGKQKHLGTFQSEIMAAMAYDEAAKIVFGDFACTNHDLGLL